MDLPEESTYEFLRSQRGDITLKINGKYIHSSYDPVKEGKREAFSVATEGKKYLIVYGLGLGYHINPHLNNKSLKLIVIEEREWLVKKVLSMYGDKYRRGNLLIFVGDLNRLLYCLLNEINEVESGEIAQLVHVGSYNLSKGYYKRAQKIVGQIQKAKLQSYITTLSFSRRWHENILKNLRYLRKSGIFKKRKVNIPVFLITSGPSLDENIKELGIISKKGIVIAVGSVYHRLREEGIKVDFIISTDGGIANRVHLEGLDKGEHLPYLITTLSVVPNLFRKWEDKLILINQDLPIERELLPSIVTKIPMLGSISLVSFEIAKSITTGDIYLIGFDFAYKDSLYHYKGNRIEEYLRYKSDKLMPLETGLARLQNRFGTSMVANELDKPIKTNFAMKSYLDVFETLLSQNSLKVFNLKGASSLNIKGSVNCSFSDIYKLVDVNIISEDLIFFENLYKAYAKRVSRMLNEFKRLQNFLVSQDSQSVERVYDFIDLSFLKDEIYFTNGMLFKRLREKEDVIKWYTIKEELIYYTSRTIIFLEESLNT